MRRGGVELALAELAVTRGGAFLRGQREKDPQAQVRAGDKVEVSFPLEDAAPAAALDKSRLLFLDADVIAVDKPAGVAAQEELAGGAALPELCSALLASMGEAETEALLVHRLDKGTTGVTLLARNKASQARLLEDFRERRVRKEYRALSTQPPSETMITALVEGRTASTRVQVLETFPLGAHIAAFPETGRTHQVRLHLESVGAPLLGDRQHGGPVYINRADGSRLDFERPMLHALSLKVVGGLRVEAPVPPDFIAALKWLAIQ
ncbi:MAG TPA: RluA family pseudouridine synthase [Myxococcales bacterium]|nr:RluA family pseudouridine synthase [Myxococcales bacterium]